jgi:formylglycine-generating enzyme required for sulfatase activity
MLNHLFHRNLLFGLLLTGVFALAVCTLLIGRAQRAKMRALRDEEQARKDQAQVERDTRSDAVPEAGAGNRADPEAKEDRPEVLAELLLDTDAKEYAVLRPMLEKHRRQTAARMREELKRRPDYWKDGPLNQAWKAPAGELVREVEKAGGLFAEHFALCQALPLERLAAVTEGLRAAGYRPVRVRPLPLPPAPSPKRGGGEAAAPLSLRFGGRGVGGDGGLLCAVVWTRDGLNWALKTGLTAAQVKDSPAGMVPADVAGYATKDGDRFAVLWCESAKDEQAVVYAGVPEQEHKTHTDAYRADGYIAATIQGLAGADGKVRYSGVWWKGAGKPPHWRLWWGFLEPAYDDLVFAGEYLLIDVHVGPGRPPAAKAEKLDADRAGAPRWYASVWWEDPSRQAVGLHGLSAEAHLARCRELAENDYRPVGLSLAQIPGENGPVAASVWHRPVLPPAEQEQLARRQATAAVTLLNLNQPAEVWPLFRHSPDPTVRSYLLEYLGSRGVNPRLLVDRLKRETNVTARRALILALGEYTEKELPSAVREPLVENLLGWYRDDPDAGVHGAIDWLLRQGKEGPRNRPLDWKQGKELERIDEELARGNPDGTRGWYVNREGHAMTVIKGPVEFRMGSPPWEPERDAANESPHRRIIGRSFALAAKPVTVAQWQRFLKDRPGLAKEGKAAGSGSDPEGPMTNVSWYLAAQYCNWLSEKEGIPLDEWCYPEKIAAGMKPLPDYLKRKGYRLPSEAEWEYACRAETTSSRYFGSSEELLPRYSWYVHNAQERTWPVGQKRPNDLGLFDLYGSATNWCAEPFLPYPRGRVEDKEYLEAVENADGRVIRGASSLYRPFLVRSAYRASFPPATSNSTTGLRIARTLP